MAYVGRSPRYGFLEGQSATFDGSTTTVTLQRSVSSTDAIDVYIDNVHQEPDEAYTLSDGGSSITFTGTPENGAVLYIRFHGISFDTTRAYRLENSDGGSTATLGDDDSFTLSLDGTTALSATSSGVTIANLTVTGTTTTINSTDLNIGDNKIVLNADLPSDTGPTQDAGIVVNRGSGPDKSFIWSESFDQFGSASDIYTTGKFHVRGSGSDPTYGATTLAAFRNSGTDDDAFISIIGNSGRSSGIYFGNESDEDAAFIYYQNSNQRFNLNRTLYTGNVVVGGAGNSTLTARHIDGKEGTSANDDHLYLQYSSGMKVNIGSSGAGSGLDVYGPVDLKSSDLKIAGTTVIDSTGNFLLANTGDYLSLGGLWKLGRNVSGNVENYEAELYASDSQNRALHVTRNNGDKLFTFDAANNQMVTHALFANRANMLFDKTGTATSSSAQYDSRSLIFRTSSWDVNNAVAKDVNFTITATPRVPADNYSGGVLEIKSNGGNTSPTIFKVFGDGVWSGTPGVSRTGVDVSYGRFYMGGSLTVDENRKAYLSGISVPSTSTANAVEFVSDISAAGGSILHLERTDSTKQVYMTWDNDQGYAGLGVNDTGKFSIGTKADYIGFETGYTQRGYFADSGLYVDGLIQADAKGIRLGSGYSALSQTGSGAMTILGHNALKNDDVINSVVAVNTGYHSHFMRMYYSHGIAFHTSSVTRTAGDVVYDFATPSNVVSGSGERMRITPSGHVGINESSPDGRFHVKYGNINESVNVDDQSDYSDPIVFERNSAAGKNAIILKGSDNIGTAIEQGRYNSASTWETYLSFKAHDSQTGGNVSLTALDEVMQVRGNGKVNITSSGSHSSTQNFQLNLNAPSGNNVGIQMTQDGSAYAYVFNDGNWLNLASDQGQTGLKVRVNRSAPDDAVKVESDGGVVIPGAVKSPHLPYVIHTTSNSSSQTWRVLKFSWGDNSSSGGNYHYLYRLVGNGHIGSGSNISFDYNLLVARRTNYGSGSWTWKPSRMDFPASNDKLLFAYKNETYRRDLYVILPDAYASLLVYSDNEYNAGRWQKGSNVTIETVSVNDSAYFTNLSLTGTVDSYKVNYATE